VLVLVFGISTCVYSVSVHGHADRYDNVISLAFLTKHEENGYNNLAATECNDKVTCK